MNSSYSLTARDLELLAALTLRVRFFSLAQVARTWWEDSAAGRANAQARLQVLERAGLITPFLALAHPELSLAAPLYGWEPGQPDPDLGAASYRLQARWRLPAVATPAVLATRAAGHRFGGRGGRFPRQSEQTHDLHVSTLFLRYRHDHPAWLSYWIGEERLREETAAGAKLPDALLRLPTGDRVLEFGGAYSKAKLTRFHEHCVTFQWTYELW